MFGTNELEQCRKTKLEQSDISELIDLQSIQIDTSKPVAERIPEFLEQVRNPYLFKVGDVAMKVNYGDGKAFSDAIAALLQ